MTPGLQLSAYLRAASVGIRIRPPARVVETHRRHGLSAPMSPVAANRLLVDFSSGPSRPHAEETLRIPALAAPILPEAPLLGRPPSMGGMDMSN